MLRRGSKSLDLLGMLLPFDSGNRTQLNPTTGFPHAREHLYIPAIVCCRKGPCQCPTNFGDLREPLADQPICAEADSSYITRFLQPRSTIFFHEQPIDY